MNLSDIQELIKKDIEIAFRKYYEKKFPSESETDFKERMQDKAKEYLSSLQERLKPMGYKVRRAKIPRKLKKWYKKNCGIYPHEIVLVMPSRTYDIYIEQKDFKS